MRILVTGGSGFLGRPVVDLLVGRGHEVHAVSRSAPDGPGHRHVVDLLDPMASDVCRQVQPEVLLHLAWYADPGRFWHATSENLAWLEASVRLTRSFLASGGRHLVGVGTSAEPSPGVSAPSVYAASKAALRQALLGAAPGAAAWARLHQPYGPREPATRLIPAAIDALRHGQPFETTTDGTQERDFVHVDDVAGALVAIVEAGATGDFEVGTGTATSVRDVVTGIARRLGAEQLVRFGSASIPAHEGWHLVADLATLAEVGWRPSISLDSGLDRVVAWWSEQ